MAQSVSTSITRRSVVAGLALAAAPVTLAGAQTPQTKPDKSLYERLGGIFAIALVVDHFSDGVVKNPIVGQTSKNPQLREWHTKNLDRLPGLKFMRTLWVANVSGGPFQFAATEPGKTPLGLEEAHRDLKITPAEFDEVAAELGRTLDFAKVPKREKDEVLAAFAAHKESYGRRQTRLKRSDPEWSILYGLAVLMDRRHGPGLSTVDFGLLVQDHVQQRTVDLDVAVVGDKAQLPKLVHEKADA